MEVRWRGRRDFGLAEESLDHRKRQALRRAVGRTAGRRDPPRRHGRCRGCRSGSTSSRSTADRTGVRRSATTAGSGPDHRHGWPDRERLGPVLHSRPLADGPEDNRPFRVSARHGAHTRITVPGGMVPDQAQVARPEPTAPQGIRGGTTAGGHRSAHRLDAPAPGGRRPLRPPDAPLEPEDAPVHLRGAQRDPHHRPRPDGQAPRHGARVRHRDGRPRRERAVRRHQEAGAGAGDAGGDARRPALRHQALAGRHDDQLRHDQEAHRAARPARGPAARRRLRPPPQEGGRRADRGAQQAQRDARRHPQDEAPAGRHLRRRPAPRAHRGHRGQQARDPGHRHGRHQRRPGRARLHHPGQRRRDPCDPAALPAGRRRGDRGCRPARGARLVRARGRSEAQAVEEPEFDETAAADLVAQLAAGGTLSFDPDLRRRRPAARLAPADETPVPAGVAAPAEAPAEDAPADSIRLSGPPAQATRPEPPPRTPTARAGVRTPYARDTGATRPWQSRPTPSRSSASEPARA